MPDLLIRDCDEDTKRMLAVRAASHGRSQQAEALDILRTALQGDARRTWVDVLLENAHEVGGMEFEPPKRHAPRLSAVELPE